MTTNTPGNNLENTPGNNPAKPRLDRDVTCLNCGYNLRGSLAEGTCPECGMAVRISLHEDPLAAAPAPYLRRLRRGAALLALGTVLTLPLLIVGLVPAALGIWLLTAPQPRRENPAGEQRLRWITRILVLLATLGLLAITAVLCLSLARHGRHILGVADWRHLDALLIAGCGLFWLGLFTFSLYLESLAQRIPRDNLRRIVRVFRRHWIVGLAIIVTLGLAAQAADWIYRTQNIHLIWVAPAFAAMTAIILLWLWATTLTTALHLRRHLPKPDDDRG